MLITLKKKKIRKKEPNRSTKKNSRKRWKENSVYNINYWAILSKSACIYHSKGQYKLQTLKKSL